MMGAVLGRRLSRRLIWARYIVRFDGSVAEITRPVSSVLVYRIPYGDLKKKKYPDIDNNFIVYILFGRNAFGKDAVYVGKSTNGMKNRPTSHEGKYDNWSTCFVLTQHAEKTFLNDGCIQYMEYMINERVRKDRRYVDTTDITNTGTANKSEQEDCDEYLEEAYDMHKEEVLASTSIEGAEKGTTIPASPEKIIKCSLKRNVNKCLIEATMEIRSSESYVVMPQAVWSPKRDRITFRLSTWKNVTMQR